MSIIESITEAQRLFDEVVKGSAERREQYREELEKLYVDGTLSKYGITKAQAIQIKLNDVQTLNEVYNANIKRFRNMARWYINNQKTRKAEIVDVEDITNQIYVDLRYYDFTSEKTLTKGIFITCRTVNNGGFIRYKEWANEKKASVFLQNKIFLHSPKNNEETSIEDFVKADERTTNPETIIIDKEQQESEKNARQTMLNKILKILPKSRREKIEELFGGGKNDGE